MKSPEERVRRRSPGRDEGRERDWCSGGDRDRRDEREKERKSERERGERQRRREIERYEENKSISRDKRGRESERERGERQRRREIERYEEDKSISRDVRGKERERERERRKHREMERYEEEDEREREKWKRRELPRQEEEEKRKKIHEDEETNLKCEKSAKRWQQPADHEKGDASNPKVLIEKREETNPKNEVSQKGRTTGWDHPAPSLDAGNPTAPEEVATEYVLLKGVFDPKIEEKHEVYLDIQDEVQEECCKTGAVVHDIHFDRNIGGFCFRFDSKRSAALAKKGLNGRAALHGKSIIATYLEEGSYRRRYGR